ncbi:hypothetical protein CC80DRAFT_489152 [Byssothecium circinans]|uniref:Uncharacterized protein n=1 Tax=Byssothecium circinans TaxID=147558 RepID=A0A6A5U7M0_9PLEO|nr:hypothetical protein CC80DRAFT_489152 [Byssothecium circinans]
MSLGPHRQPFRNQSLPTVTTVDAAGFARTTVVQPRTLYAFDNARLSYGDSHVNVGDSRLNVGDARRASMAGPYNGGVMIDDVIITAIDVNTIVRITNERSVDNANPAAPSFISAERLALANTDKAAWIRDVLPFIASRTFVISSNVDIDFFCDMMVSATLPNAFAHVKSVQFDRFFWFSGVKDNRTANPALLAATRLPSLERLSITLHTAGLTKSCYGERQRVQLEAIDVIKSKALKICHIEEVVKQYDLAKIFDCENLKILEIKCVDSEIIKPYCGSFNPLTVFWQLKTWFQGNFRAAGRQVAVGAEVLKNLD